jgi:hypothetical protein
MVSKLVCGSNRAYFGIAKLVQEFWRCGALPTVLVPGLSQGQGRLSMDRPSEFERDRNHDRASRVPPPTQYPAGLCTKSPVRNLTQRSTGTFWPHFKGFSRPKSSILHAKSIVKEHFGCKATLLVAQFPQHRPNTPSELPIDDAPSVLWDKGGVSV